MRRWSVSTEGQGHSGKRSPIWACSPVHTVERKPRPPEAGLCGEEPAPALGSEEQGSGPSCSLPLPKSYTLGISTWMSHRVLELMSEPSSLPTFTCFLFQTCPPTSISIVVPLSPQLQKPEDWASPSPCPCLSGQLSSPALCNLPNGS